MGSIILSTTTGRVPNSPSCFSAASTVLTNYAMKTYPWIHPRFSLSTGLYNLARGTYAISDRSKKPAESFRTMHGLFSIATGCCSLLDAFHHFGLIDLRRASAFICKTGSFCFLYTNVTDLIDNIRNYEELERNCLENPLGLSSISMQRKACIFGICSNFGYIFATAFTLFNASLAVTLVLGVISAFCGGLKILCDLIPDIKSYL